MCYNVVCFMHLILFPGHARLRALNHPWSPVYTLVSSPWLCFNQLGMIANLIKKYKNLLTIGIVLFISAMSIYIYPIKEWMVISLLIMSTVGYFIRKWDTFPVLYGFFLTDLFWNNLMRVIAIYT